MSQAAFDRLHAEVLDLIQQVETLRRERAALRARLDQLMNERAQLLQKNELACSRLEGIVNRLKAMEGDTE
ncbi:MAG TPA: TIGR02449 family protein [Candidatus Acidoferrales bacterium]|nr:TIGR02449 family protein [Candidatus Acidoferrales bacterium]